MVAVRIVDVYWQHDHEWEHDHEPLHKRVIWGRKIKRGTLTLIAIGTGSHQNLTAT